MYKFIFDWETFNPDCVDIAELEDTHSYLNNNAEQVARDIFPELMPEVGRVTVFELSKYCFNKKMAMKNRKKGNIQLAITFEKICQDIYNRLPECAKW